MMMPGRKYTGATSYRYGFNGKENDNEVKGGGNQQDYGMRVSDTRLGRFLSVDPLTKQYPWYTPYQFAGNNPIRFIDMDGGEPKDPGIPFGLTFGVIIIEGNSFVTKNFLLQAAKAHGATNPYDHLIEIGRIFEDVVLASIDLVGSKKHIYPYADRPDKYFIPDVIHNYTVVADKTTYLFENAFIEEVKFSTGNELKLEPGYNPEQLKGFIDYLADVKGVTINGIKTNDKAADYGAAALILTTPADLPISTDILKYAQDRNVSVLRRFPIAINSFWVESKDKESDAIKVNTVKVSPAFTIVPSVNKKTTSDLYRAQQSGKEESGSNTVGDKVEINWSKLRKI